jgi:hypothetical protein
MIAVEAPSHGRQHTIAWMGHSYVVIESTNLFDFGDVADHYKRASVLAAMTVHPLFHEGP